MSRLVIAGYGFRGRQWHDHASGHRDFELAGVADPAPEAREHAERRGLRSWQGLDEALADAKPDAVIVASPPWEHAGHACSALGAGAAVLVEKPLALSAADATRVADAAAEAGLPALVGHNFRYRPTELALRSVLGQLGELRHMAVTSVRPAEATPAHMRSLAHAPLWDMGTHHLDLLRTRVGRAPDELSTLHDGSTYVMRLEWSGGPSAVYSLHTGGPVFHHHEWLQGDAAGLSLQPGRLRLLSPTRRLRRVRVGRRDRAEARLLDALARGGEAAMSARDAVATVAMVEAAVGSLAPAEEATL